MRFLSISSSLALALLTPCSAAILIDVGVRNGGFELLGGSVDNTAKATSWSTDPDGNVDFWVSLPSATADTDSGTDETAPGGIYGGREAFFQDGNLAYNLTTETIDLGEVFNYGFAHTEDDRVEGIAYLAYLDGADNIVAIAGTDLTGGNVEVGPDLYSSSWAVTAGDWIGRPIALVLGDAPTAGGFPELDNAFLEVVPEPSIAILGSLGLIGLIGRRRR